MQATLGRVPSPSRTARAESYSTTPYPAPSSHARTSLRVVGSSSTSATSSAGPEAAEGLPGGVIAMATESRTAREFGQLSRADLVSGRLLPVPGHQSISLRDGGDTKAMRAALVATKFRRLGAVV